ncbi:hypothetical protein [Kitasatospora sp. NPDC047058]|uniref:hypothetical protein n=1 Tax=Kitasatospora sp. NPDC047058 TaxID=3155620 RepID=UPI0033C558F8
MVLRWLLAGFLGLCVVFTVSVVAWGVVALTRDHTRPETDLSRAERLAGLSDEQHPGKGRYYIAADAVLARAPDGTATGYLHYRLGGGIDVNVEDFLRTYDLPQPGGPAPLPEDLKAALPGDEPADAALLPGDPGSSGHRQVWVVPSPTGLQGAGDIYVRATG